MQYSRLISIDPSLTCSGWALFEIASGKLLGVGKVRPPGPGLSLSTRLRDLQVKVGKLLVELELGETDVMVCEGPTTMKDPQAAIRVEQVRGIFEALARERSLEVPGRLNPRTVQYEVMGLKGSQLNREIVKQTAVSTVWSIYRSPIEQLGLSNSAEQLGKKHQDIVDAILLGSLAIERVQSAERVSEHLSTLFEEGRNPRARRAPES